MNRPSGAGRGIGGVAAAALALALLPGCTHTDNARVQQDVKGMRQEFSRTADGVRQAAAEAELASKVKAAISLRKGMEARDLKVEVHGTDVTLKGDVRSREQADLAEQIARETQGVGAVTNELMLRIPAKSEPPATPSEPGATPPPASTVPASPGGPSSGGTPSGSGY